MQRGKEFELYPEENTVIDYISLLAILTPFKFLKILPHLQLLILKS